MKAQEKEIIFNLLKAASDNYYGYESAQFAQKPVFQDDQEKIISEEKPAFEEKITEKEAEKPAAAVKVEEPASVSEVKNAPSLDAICQKINCCTRCGLHSGRTNVVPGTGIPGSSVLVIGEGPGEEEDKQGLPFVGPAGQLLDKMLAAIQLDRKSNCYISNIVKCRPPYNRDPLKEEADACKSFLDAQIHILKPKIILALGKVALRNLLSIEGEFSLNKYRGKIFEYQGIPVITTYHPSALLRNIEFKKPAWEDLKFFKSELEKIDPSYGESFQVNK